jgi:hypothetical protein
MTSYYFRGQGKVYIANLDANDAITGGFRFVGNVPDLKLQLATEPTEHRESTSGNRSVDLIIDQVLSGKLMTTLEDFSKKNLSLAMFGTDSTVSGATATDEEIIAKLGYSVPLSKINVTAFTSLEVGANTITASGNYSVDLKSGMITFEEDPTDTNLVEDATCLCTYTYGGHSKVTGFTQSRKNYWLRFDGLNTVDSSKPVVIDIYKVTFDPQKELALINTELSKMEVDGNMLYSNAGPEGNYFRVRYLGT